jgi:hypothetical protein
MSALDDALNFVKKDPVGGFIAIPIIGARPPRPQIVVKLKGRSLVLPDWSGDEWTWYGDLAIKYADSVSVSARGRDDRANANRRLTELRGPMKSLGSSKPAPEAAAAYYDRCVRLVIAAHVGSDSDSGQKFVDAFKEAVKEAPTVIGEALAAALSAGGDVLTPVVKEALKIAGQVFDAALGTSIGLIAIVALGLYLWSKSRNKEE